MGNFKNLREGSFQALLCTAGCNVGWVMEAFCGLGLDSQYTQHNNIYGCVMKELCRRQHRCEHSYGHSMVELNSHPAHTGYSHTASIRTNFKCRSCQVVLWVRYFMFWEFRGEGLRSGLWLPRYKLLHLLGSSQVYTSLDICNWLKLLVWRYCCDLICRAEFCHT